MDRRSLINKVVYSVGALLLPLAGPEPAARAAAARSRPTLTAGEADLESVRGVLATFNSTDERLGGGHGRSAVVEYLTTDVAGYLRGRFATDTTRSSMFGLAAQLAYLAGWKAHDLGRTGLAQQYYLNAVDLARESSPAQVAYCMRILAHQAMDLDHSQHCVDLADAALQLSKDRVDPDTESLFWLTAARAHAAGGSPRQARTMLTRAGRVLNRSRGDASPAWVSLGGNAQARLANHTAKALRALGDLASAEDQFAQAARCWNPTTHPRIHALTLAELAETQCESGAVEKACQTWNRVLDEVAGIQSTRTREAVKAMRQHLTPYRRRGLPAVSHLMLARTPSSNRRHTNTEAPALTAHCSSGPSAVPPGERAAHETGHAMAEPQRARISAGPVRVGERDRPSPSGRPHRHARLRPGQGGPPGAAFVVVICSRPSRVLGHEVLSDGSATKALLPVRETVTAVLRRDGQRFALAHNHPSGDPTPSTDDHVATLRIMQAAEATGLTFLGHVVVTDNCWRRVIVGPGHP